MKIICISDTHGFHRNLKIPWGDLLIHAGDFTNFSKSRLEIEDFEDWLGQLPHRYKIVIPGNHEFAFEENPRLNREISNTIFLVNESTEIDGLAVWGSPVTNLYGGAFGYSSAADRRQIYSAIPKHIDILITHAPPFGILDQPPGTNRHDGCRELLAAVNRVRPRLHVFGHIHGAWGIHDANGTVFANAALTDQYPRVVHAPIVIELQPR